MEGPDKMTGIKKFNFIFRIRNRMDKQCLRTYSLKSLTVTGFIETMGVPNRTLEVMR